MIEVVDVRQPLLHFWYFRCVTESGFQAHFDIAAEIVIVPISERNGFEEHDVATFFRSVFGGEQNVEVFVDAALAHQLDVPRRPVRLDSRPNAIFEEIIPSH